MLKDLQPLIQLILAVFGALILSFSCSVKYDRYARRQSGDSTATHFEGSLFGKGSIPKK